MQSNNGQSNHINDTSQLVMDRMDSNEIKRNQKEHIDKTIIQNITVKNLTARYPKKEYPSIVNVSFSLCQGQMMAIMGPSGSGKSSLIQALLDKIIVEQGDIFVNGKKCTNALLDFKTHLGFAPQDDILDDSLTVFENLYFYQKLKSDSDRHKRNVGKDIDNILSTFNILHKRDKRVVSRDTKLSGGQRRRLNMAMELLNDPDVLILDEPTSGLSSKDSEQLISFLKDLTHQGKMVLLVIHQPSSAIYKMFDKVLIVNIDGEQLFFGDPLKALEVFIQVSKDPHISKDYVECPTCKKVDPDILLNAQEDAQSDYWNSLRLPQCPGFTKDPHEELCCPKEQNKRGEHKSSGPPHKPLNGSKSILNQLVLQTKRQMLSKSRDRLNQLFSFVIPPILGVLGGLVFRFTPDNQPYSIVENEHYVHFLFLIVITGMFFGLMASVFEIIKDKTMLQRESLGGTSVGAYYFAKFLVLTLFAVVQSFAFLIPAHWILDVKYMLMVNGGLMILISSIGIGFGLLFSALSTSVLAAYNLVPLILIPQIILGGGFIPYQQMSSSLYVFEKGWALTCQQDKSQEWHVNKYKAPILARLLPASWALEFLVTANYSFHPVSQLKSEKQLALEQVAQKYKRLNISGKLPQNTRYQKRKEEQQIRKKFDLEILEKQAQLNKEIGDMGAGLTLQQRGEFKAQHHDYFTALSGNRYYNDILSRTWFLNIIELSSYLLFLYLAGFFIIRSTIRRR